MIRISLRNDTAGCNQSDCSLGKIFYSRVRSNSVERRHRILCLKRFAGESSSEASSTARLDPRSFFEEVHTNAVRHIAFLAGSTDRSHALQASEQAEPCFRLLFSYLQQSSLWQLMYTLCLEHISTRVLCVHTCHCRNAKLFLNSVTDCTAGNTVTSGVECRTCNEYIRAVFLYTTSRISAFALSRFSLK